MRVSPYEPVHAAATAALFHASVHRLAVAEYTPQQCQAWSPAPPDTDSWNTRLAGMWSWVALDGQELIGFLALRQDGYLDLLYVHPELAGKGVAQTLYDVAIAEAGRRQLTRLTTHASHLARRFFARQGWHYDGENRVERGGIVMTNHRMSLTL